MRIRIAYSTIYAYGSPSKAIIQRLRLTPRSHDGQHVNNWRIDVDADGRLRAVVSRSLMHGDGHNQRRVVLEAGVPVFLVNGANDPFIRQSYMAGFEDHARDRHVDVIEGAGHASFLERPEPFNTILERFLDTVAARRAMRAPRVASSF
mgnify:CR=1 FL=1